MRNLIQRIVVPWSNGLTSMHFLQFGLLCAWVLCAGCVGRTQSEADLRSDFLDVAHSKLSALNAGSTNVHWIHSIGDLPRPIQKSMRRGQVADAGKPFSATCTGRFPHRRFLAGTASDRIYYVALEFGGEAYYWDVYRFILDRDGAISQAAKAEPDP